jgi:hypothetical protein
MALGAQKTSSEMFSRVFDLIVSETRATLPYATKIHSIIDRRHERPPIMKKIKTVELRNGMVSNQFFGFPI